MFFCAGTRWYGVPENLKTYIFANIIEWRFPKFNLFYIEMSIIVIVKSKFLQRNSKTACGTPAYSRALKPSLKDNPRIIVGGRFKVENPKRAPVKTAELRRLKVRV